jgi:hypothetical protein
MNGVQVELPMSCHSPIYERTIGNLQRTWADLSPGIPADLNGMD